MSKNSTPVPLFKVENLTKKYGDFTAVRKLNFEVHRGEIFGFLGPNGAGKTTTINMICGLLKPDGGKVIINGVSHKDGTNNIRHLVGLCPQNIVLWEMLTCLEQLEFMGTMYGIDRKKARKKGVELLQELGLIEKKDKLAKTLSGGMQRRLNIALALVHEPQILILDEPQAGLDPQSRILLRDYIKSISRKMTVVLTTHDMDEAERLADRIAVIDRGELLVLDTPEKLKNQAGTGEILEIKIEGLANTDITPVINEFSNKVNAITYRDGLLSVFSNEALELLPDVIHSLKQNNIVVKDMKLRKRTLEDVFISLTGRGLRE